MIRQDAAGWIGGITISLALHAGLLLQAGAPLGVEQAPPTPAPLVTRLNFLKETRPQPVAEVKPRPPKPRPEPRPQTPKPGPPEPEKITPPEPEPVPQQLAQAPPQGQLTDTVDALFIQQQQQLYMHDLLTHIEGYKFYPTVARRRGIEGEVRVSFTLLANGHMQNLQLEGGQLILRQAAKQAMEEAAPLPLPPASMSLPRRIDIGVVYSLKH